MTETMDPLVSIDLRDSLRRNRDTFDIPEILRVSDKIHFRSEVISTCGRAQHKRVHVKETALSRFYGNTRARTRTRCTGVVYLLTHVLDIFSLVLFFFFF